MAHTTPAYLALSRHGIFYFRITVPKTLRTVFGAREVKHSLKTRARRTAIPLARLCTTHYERLFATLQEHPVTYLEMKQLLQAAKASLLESLISALERDGPLTRADRTAVVSELKVLRTLVPSNQYPPKAQAMADSVLASANIGLPPTSPTYERFCVETAKMLDTLLQAYLAHSEALDGYTDPVTPASAPTQTPATPVRLERPEHRSDAGRGGS